MSTSITLVTEILGVEKSVRSAKFGGGASWGRSSQVEILLVLIASGMGMLGLEARKLRLRSRPPVKPAITRVAHLVLVPMRMEVRRI